MKRTTPTYGEEKTGKATFQVKVPLVPIAPILPGQDVMLKDIYDRLRNTINDYQCGVFNRTTFCEKLDILREKLSHHPTNAYYDNWIMDPISKDFVEHQVVKFKMVKELLSQTIKKYFPNGLYRYTTKSLNNP